MFFSFFRAAASALARARETRLSPWAMDRRPFGAVTSRRHTTIDGAPEIPAIPPIRPHEGRRRERGGTHERTKL
jgi:hypothetical protein